MTDGLKWTVNEVPKSDDTYLELMSETNVQKANEFHKSFPQYTGNSSAEAFRPGVVSGSKKYLLQGRILPLRSQRI